MKLLLVASELRASTIIPLFWLFTLCLVQVGCEKEEVEPGSKTLSIDTDPKAADQIGTLSREELIVQLKKIRDSGLSDTEKARAFKDLRARRLKAYLSKSIENEGDVELKPLPEPPEWRGITDPEERARQRFAWTLRNQGLDKSAIKERVSKYEEILALRAQIASLPRQNLNSQGDKIEEFRALARKYQGSDPAVRRETLQSWFEENR